MKSILVLVLVFALFSVSVLALSPTIEAECCTYIDNLEDPYYVNTLSEMCPLLNLTKETCEPILEGWKSAQSEFARSFRGDTFDYPEEGYDGHIDVEPEDPFDMWGYRIFA